MQRIALSVLLGAAVAQAMFLRGPPAKPEARVLKLVQDIEESVSKAGEDAEVVFSTLLTYDGQLDSSLKKEIGTLNHTMASLQKMEGTYKVDLNSSNAKAKDLGTSAKDSKKMASKYEEETSQTRAKIDNLSNNVQMLVALLRHAQVTEQGKLVTPESPDARGEPARVFTAIRRLLRGNPTLESSHPDVYAAFLPKGVSGSELPVVHMTQSLLMLTIEALGGVKNRLQSMEAQALVQFGSLRRRFEGDAAAALASAQAQQGLDAENEQKATEIAYSIQFTSAVLNMDRTFGKSLQDHIKSNNDLILSIRDLRQAQLKILGDLSSVFTAEGAITAGGLSFLEEAAETTPIKKSSLLSLDSVQSEAEEAIHKNGDTHAILMRVQSMLDENEPVNAQSVHDTMTEMQGVLRNVEESQPKYEEAKRACESQSFHAKEQEEGLKANFALMSAAHDHAQKAIKAAQTNIQGIVKKTQALDKSAKDFSHISTEALKALNQQSKDRRTILMAVRKAMEVLSPPASEGQTLAQVYSETGAANARVSTVELMKSLSEDMTTQEVKETAFREQQSQFKDQFKNYVRDYTRLLEERHRHYKASLGVLQLHVSELSNDLQAQQQTLSGGEELSGQSASLCQSVLHFHEKHAKLRDDLSTALRSILPGMSHGIASDDLLLLQTTVDAI